MVYDRNRIPFLSGWMLKNLYRFSLHEGYWGDLQEEYRSRRNTQSGARVRVWLWMHLLRSLPVFLNAYIRWSLVMFWNTIKIAFRTIRRDKGYTFINLSGLSLGMAVCILVLLWVQNEISYDRFHHHTKQLYRVEFDAEYSGQTMRWPVVPIPVGPALNQMYPEVENAVRITPCNPLVQYEENRYDEKGAYVDPSFLMMFTFPLEHGDVQTALSDPHSIVITEELAHKYFGDEDAVGRVLTLNDTETYRVSSVLRNMPPNTHLRFDLLIPYQRFIQMDRDPENWGRFQTLTYVLLREGIRPESFSSKIAPLLEERAERSKGDLILEPLRRLYLFSEFGGGNSQAVKVFSLVAVFVLLIGCANFINLTTARSSLRLKEIGMRKVTGASRRTLIKQFMGESIIFSLVALAIALLLVVLLSPVVHRLTGKSLLFQSSSYAEIIFGIVSVVVLTALLSGIYPALVLSSFQPTRLFRGQLFLGASGKIHSMFRKILVVFQFSISGILIIFTLIVQNQINFIRRTDMGYNRENIIYMPIRGDMNAQVEAMKTELLTDPNILNVTATSMLPTEIATHYNAIDWEGRDPDHDPEMYLARIDHDFFETLGIRILEGREFKKESIADAQNFIVNEEALRVMGVDAPLGKKMTWSDMDGSIIGVVEDFHFRSLHESIPPLVLVMKPDRFEYVCVRLRTNIQEPGSTIQHMQKTWQTFAPEFPFEYHYLNELIDVMYRSEERLARLFSYFTAFALFISCFGLFGLASFTAERRTKEIGIRKVMGASVSNIVLRLSREFLAWVIVANLIAWPVTYFLAQQWLQSFAYRIDIKVMVFFLSSCVMLFISVITVSYKAMKAARSNPINALRFE